MISLRTLVVVLPGIAIFTAFLSTMADQTAEQ
jgi:hypothetical protein